MNKIENIKVNLQMLVDLRTSPEYDLSISDVAEALGYKTPTGYWLVENGQRGVSVNTLHKLSQLYHHAMEEFIVPETEG